MELIDQMRGEYELEEAQFITEESLPVYEEALACIAWLQKYSSKENYSEDTNIGEESRVVVARRAAV
ncbi:MAG TPA: hypothetical protein VIN08_18775 [Ohtaekwangia sp.]|uniref:hypothetical protein n=1 Tax=Ohtaekwangia sp. TaxID=2066019 RepID=UPI002F951C12